MPVTEWTVSSGDEWLYGLEWSIGEYASWLPAPPVSLSPTSGALAFGEETPTAGESAVAWQTWSDGAAGDATISGDPDWGKLQLSSGDVGHSGIYDFGDSANRYHTVTEDVYGTGQEDATIYIRGQTAVFTQDAVTPAWEVYASPIWKTWRYMQIKVGN